MRESGCLAIREGTSVNLPQEKVSLEKAALKDIIRRRWETELGTGRQQSKEVKDQLDTHISNVKGILNNYDYEIFCMPNVIANTKTMSRNDTKDYLKHIEALAVGYSSVFGSDLATLLLIGLTCKSRSVSSIAKYYDNFSSDINRKAVYYDNLLQKHSDFMSRVNYEIKVTESGLLKFFRKKKVVKLKKIASHRTNRIKAIEKKRSTYRSIISSMSR